MVSHLHRSAFSTKLTLLRERAMDVFLQPQVELQFVVVLV